MNQNICVSVDIDIKGGGYVISESGIYCSYHIGFVCNV